MTQSTSQPPRVPRAWADAGDRRAIPADSQIPIKPGAASLADGFPPLCSTPLASGGIAPDRLDINGVLWLLSANARWNNAGGPALYDPAFAAALGGYPKGAVLRSATAAGVSYTSLAENNMDNPDSGAASWLASSVVTAGGNLAATATLIRVGPLVVQAFQTPQVNIPPAGATAPYDFAFPQPFPNACIWVGGVDGNNIGFTWGAFSNVNRLGGTGYVWSQVGVPSPGAQGALLAVGY